MLIVAIDMRNLATTGSSGYFLKRAYPTGRGITRTRIWLESNTVNTPWIFWPFMIESAAL